MLVQQLLQVAAEKLEPLGYMRCDDRVLTALDVAMRTLCPLAGCPPEKYSEFVKARQQATCEIAKTILGQEHSEEESYLFLTVLGKTIPLEQLDGLLKRTLKRLQEAPATAAA